jgi:predicted DNA-binding transcriptional regulator AlpA
MEPADELFPGVRLGAPIPRRRYAAILGLHPKTCYRHEQEDPEFPKPVYLNGRAFLPSEVLEAYRQKLIERGYTRTGTYPANPPKRAEG